MAILLPACACLAFAASGCSLFHHHEKKPKPWLKQPAEPGPMQPDPRPMEANPVEPHPMPIEPDPESPQ